MTFKISKFKKWAILLSVAFILLAAGFAVGSKTDVAANASEFDYNFETVPIENIELAVDDNITEIQPRQSFTLTYAVNPWYTTTKNVYLDVVQGAATVTEISEVSISNGVASGTAVVTVSDDAEVGGTLSIVASADEIISNTVELSVCKIPVTGLKLSLLGSDDKLHIGKTRTVSYAFEPSYATCQDVRYELSGEGTKYIESFDETSGTIKAKKNVTLLDVNSTVTITAYSVDNCNAYDSVTLTLYMPSTTVEISASTPHEDKNNKPIAVASSTEGDTVNLHTKVNGVETYGLNYVIEQGQEYVVNGLVRPDGTFSIKPNMSWTSNMRKPNPEIKIKAAYSDGYDEVFVPLYVPVERISFINSVPNEVENNRSYNLEAEAFPKFATLLKDNTPIRYTLNGLSNDIANIDVRSGLLKLPKSLTSKGSIINYSAYLQGALEGVDVEPLTHNLNIVPVYASGFSSVTINKNGKPIGLDNQVYPSDELSVNVEYTTDNVTEINFSLSTDSSMLVSGGNKICIADLTKMVEDSPKISVTIEYNSGGKSFEENSDICIYVPALSAKIEDAKFNRGEALNLKELITINVHGHATNKDIEWGEPTVTNSKSGIAATCIDGMLHIDSQANAGTVVTVPYRTFDSNNWQYKTFTVAPLSGEFTIEYGESNNTVDSRQYAINIDAPQLEERQNVDLSLKFNGKGAAYNFGLTYSVQISDNANLILKSSDEDFDLFNLSAKSGQSGRNNNISFIITVYDGSYTYYVHTCDIEKPDNAEIDFKTNCVSIFNRISGEIGISNETVEHQTELILVGWDELATFNKEDLNWSMQGGLIENCKIIDAPESGFIMKISANQKYNNAEISFSAEIAFNSIIYKEGSRRIKSTFKKQGCSAVISYKLCHPDGYVQTGWSVNENGSKAYEFKSIYSDNKDLTLYPYFVQTQVTVMIEEEPMVLEESLDCKYTHEEYIGLDFDVLRSLGYTHISVEIRAYLEKTSGGDRYAQLCLDLDDSYAFDSIQFKPRDELAWHYFYRDVDILKFTNQSKIRLEFVTPCYADVYNFLTWKFYKAEITFTALEQNE